MPDKHVLSEDSTCAKYPSLDDYWNGTADIVMTDGDTGLPMGESDTVLLPDGKFRSYVHASFQSAGVMDSCGDPVDFPGCVITFESKDGGHTFTATTNEDTVPTCLIPCNSCPCDSKRDHIDQQQYPRVSRVNDRGENAWLMVYEYRGSTFLRTSTDGLTWSDAQQLPNTGVWQTWLMPCSPEELIGEHPFAPRQYDCLVGAPPGLLITTEASHDYATENGPYDVYIFVGQGQNPGSLGCFVASLGSQVSLFRKCNSNPLFTGAKAYGESAEPSAQANANFDFRTISSADLVRVDDRLYLFYEGVRGPSEGEDGDTQFALGLARSLDDSVDGQWETFPYNPILVDLPGNVGVGHADVVIDHGRTILYTSVDGEKRSRFELVWK